MSDMFYRIAWKKQGIRGQGPYCLSLDVALNWLKSLKRMYPHIMHWIEYEINSIPYTLQDYSAQGVDSSLPHGAQQRRLSLVHLRDT